MADHQATVKVAGTGWIGACDCGAHGRVQTDHRLAGDWVTDHLHIVAQARAHAHGRTPSLASQRDYFRSMASSEAQPPEHRLLWTALADELDARLGTNDTSQQDPLF